MAGESKIDIIPHSPDSYVDMIFRRKVNEEFAEDKVNFYEVGYEMAAQYTDLGYKDAVLDVGCSSGWFAIEGAEAAGLKSFIIGLEPEGHLYDHLPDGVDTRRFAFMEGFGENIPLPDSAVKLVTAHNVIFRANDLPRFLKEIGRVAEPGGLVAVSTNAENHAFWRHTFEHMVAEVVEEKSGIEIEPPHIPAEGCYLEDLPDILEITGGFKLLDSKVQSSVIKVTKDRLGTYLDAIKYSVNNTDLDDYGRSLWRASVDEVVKPEIELEIAKMAKYNESQGIVSEPYFKDIIKRGLILARNLK